MQSNDLQQTEELIRTLYVQNEFEQLLKMKADFVKLCNQDAEKAALFLPLLIKARIAAQQVQNNSSNAKKTSSDLDKCNSSLLYEEYQFILQNISTSLIPISLMVELFKLRDQKLQTTEQIHALLDEYLLGCLKVGIHNDDTIGIRLRMQQERQHLWPRLAKFLAYLSSWIPSQKVCLLIMKFCTNAKVYSMFIAILTLVFAMKRRVK